MFASNPFARSPWYVTSCLLLLLGLSSGCQVASQGLNAEGARLHQQGNYQGASQRFLKAIENDPNNADSYYNLAATSHRLARYSAQQPEAQKAHFQQAENYYNQCLDRDPNHRDCYRGLAVLLVETGRQDAAFRLLDGWVTRNPASAEPRIELARLRDEFGDPEKARQRLLEALAIEPNNSRALTALGKLREEAGEHQQAMQNYERSLALNRFQPQVATRIASLQTALGNSTQFSAPGSTRTVNGPTQWRKY